MRGSCCGGCSVAGKVYVLPVGIYNGIYTFDCLVLENFDHAAPEGTRLVKGGGNHTPLLICPARNDGYGITLHLDLKTRTYIDEFSMSGFLAIKCEGEKTTLVIADSKNVTNSITSNLIEQIARDLG
ncbi:hypothetical protein FN846DRAFT_896741 [Sphaerosporella brunnea]|uniref:Uncharacterized protein n=1 Tax=Sphaerosporella brunnea TaxID=1250544 RepID=A0A5J5EB17_9PEZI|nr:hypothetical protein FN846DRAFT_896741 [Sphaerosporella brunnea]